MKGYFISNAQIKEIKTTMSSMKKEIKRLEKKLENDTADAFDSTNLDLLTGEVAGMTFVLDVITREE